MKLNVVFTGRFWFAAMVFGVLLALTPWAQASQGGPFNEKLCPVNHPDPGMLSDQSPMCFAQCKPGYAGAGPLCVQATVSDCVQTGTCLAAPVCKPGESQVLGVCMANCPSGYNTLGNLCAQATPAGWQDGGAFFFRNVPKRQCWAWFCINTSEYQTQSKHIYTRSASGLPSDCSKGYRGMLGVCIRSNLHAYSRSGVLVSREPETSTASFVRPVSPFAPGERFAVAVLSDTQLPWDDTSADAKAGRLSTEALWSNSRAYNQSLVQAVNALHASRRNSGSPLAFTVMNGDLTAFFHPQEVSEFRAFYDKGFAWAYPHVLQTPLYPGLGNHDYQNNVNNCRSFTLDTNRCAKNAINLIRGAVFKNYLSNMPANTLESYDASSLAYSWNRGRYHFVQLHNGPSYSIPGLGIETPVKWLKEDLARATARGQTIILNMHRPEVQDPGLLAAIDGYPVAAVFVGHLHEQLGMQAHVSTPSGQKIPVFFSGSADRQTFLLAEFDPARLTITAMSSVRGQSQATGQPVVIGFDGWSHQGGVAPSGVDLPGQGRVVEVDLRHPQSMMRFGGGWVELGSPAEQFHLLDTSRPGELSFWAVQKHGVHSKAVKIVLSNNARGGITLKPVAAKYTWGDVTGNPQFDWNSQGESAPVSNGLGTDGYGINSIQLKRR